MSCLASTRLSQYLEFKALEHICILQQNQNHEVTLQKVPNSREDVFTSTLSLQEKRKLMKFLTNAVNPKSIGSHLHFKTNKRYFGDTDFGRSVILTGI